jgi:hypothetical protein
MGTNPAVPQGVLNRVRGSVLCSAQPLLNVTASYLGEQGITFTPTGDMTSYLKTLTGAGRSPAPYVMMEGMVHILKTTPLANAYKTGWETDSYLGDLTVRPDTSKLGVFQYVNCSIMGVDTLIFNGTDIGMGVKISGIYYTNSILFDQAPG